MSRDPAVLFYTSDFLTGSSRFSDEDTGKYIRALCNQHQCGHFTKDELLQLLKSSDCLVWSKFKQDKHGKYYNKRMEDEILRREDFCNSRSHKGLSGRKKRIIRESYDIPNGNHSDNDNDNKDLIKDIYLKDELTAYNELIKNTEWIKEQQKYNPNLNILLSLEKAHTQFWGTEAGWEFTKKKKSKTKNWKRTYENALSLKTNQVWLPKDQQGKTETSKERIARLCQQHFSEQKNTSTPQ
jgi:hypothetical protein